MEIKHQPTAEHELPLYPGLSRQDVLLVDTPAHALRALAELRQADVLGFDTESKPTFRKGETSTGPHLIQLATDSRAYLFQVGPTTAIEALHELLASPTILKVGFGLSDDLKRLRSKLHIDTHNVIDLAVTLRENKRNDVGAKSAVARFFGQRLQKSKKISTTNWANPHLSDSQILYAANDAHVAIKVYRAWLSEQPATDQA